ncbi:hypothetical protein Tco_1012568, partial [Tanacetum coccineum]
LYEENLTLRVGNDELVFYADKIEKNKNKKFAHAISIIDFSKDEQFSGSTTIHSDALLPSSSPVKTSDNLLEEFADEITFPNPFPPGNDDSILKKDVHEENFQIYSNPLFEFDVNFNNPLFDEELEDIECKDSYDSNLDKSTFLVTPLSDSNKDENLIPRNDIEFLLHDDLSIPLKSVASILEGFINDPPFKEKENLFDLECKTNDEAECFNPGDDDDEIDAFLAIEVPIHIEGYFDSEGDVTYL